MATDAILVQQPAKPSQLIMLFHGVGSNPKSMLPLAQALAATFDQAMVVSVQSPDVSFAPGGYQWFSVTGITEDNRQTRVDLAMPGFVACIQHWQQQSGVGPEATALLGFSQGAIMALEASKCDPAPASRIVSLSGRFATLPERTDFSGTIHFLHGKDDPVISYEHTVMAAHHLRDLDVDLTAEVRPFVAHEIPPEFIELAVQKLANHISHRLWNAALQHANEVSAPTTPATDQP